MRNKSYEAWITSFVDRLKEYFNLQGWRITLVFSEDPAECDRDNLTYASINVTWEYQMATITLSSLVLMDFESWNIKQITQSMTHEFVHIFLAPLQDFTDPHLSEITAPLYMKLLEQETQRLTSVFLKTLPKSVIPPRPKKHGKHNPTPADDKSSPAVHS